MALIKKFAASTYYEEDKDHEPSYSAYCRGSGL